MKIAHMTMPDFESLLKRTQTAVVVLGSTEEHGQHLPLDTDTMQAVHTAELALKEVEFFLAPPLHYGYCRSTRDHPGTLSISPNTLRMLVRDIGESLYRHGVRGVIFLSGHAGRIHMAAIEEAVQELVDELDGLEAAVVCEYAWATQEGRAAIVDTLDDGHAGEIETSRIMSIAPELVSGTSPEEYPAFPLPFIARDKLAAWPGGVWGDPSKATAEKGAALYRLTAKRLAALVRRMQERVEG